MQTLAGVDMSCLGPCSIRSREKGCQVGANASWHGHGGGQKQEGCDTGRGAGKEGCGMVGLGNPELGTSQGGRQDRWLQVPRSDSRKTGLSSPRWRGNRNSG